MNTIQGIQMIGTQRSGSNLLRVMLDGIREIAAPHPPHILQRFLPLLPKYGDLTDQSNFYRLAQEDVYKRQSQCKGLYELAKCIVSGN